MLQFSDLFFLFFFYLHSKYSLPAVSFHSSPTHSCVMWFIGIPHVFPVTWLLAYIWILSFHTSVIYSTSAIQVSAVFFFTIRNPPKIGTLLFVLQTLIHLLGWFCFSYNRMDKVVCPCLCFSMFGPKVQMYDICIFVSLSIPELCAMVWLNSEQCHFSMVKACGVVWNCMCTKGYAQNCKIVSNSETQFHM